MSVVFFTNLHPTDSELFALLRDTLPPRNSDECVLFVRGTPSDGYDTTFSREYPGADSTAAWEHGSVEDVISRAKLAKAGWLAPTVMGRDGLEQDVARVTEALCIPWPSVAVAELCADKQGFGEWRTELGLAAPTSTLCNTAAEILTAVGKLDGAAVVKPVSSFGSRAVIMIGGSQDDQASAVEWHMQQREGALIHQSVVQQHITGNEYGVTCLVEQGRIKDDFFVVTRKEMTTDPFRKEIGHIFDPQDAERLRVLPLIRKDCEQMFAALHFLDGTASGLTKSFFNADVIVTDNDEVHVVDASPRLGVGGMIKLASTALGKSCDSMTFERLCLSWAAGHEVRLTQVETQHCAIVKTAFPDGGMPVRFAANNEAAQSVDGIFYLENAVATLAGEPMVPLSSIASTRGHPVVGAEGPDLATATTRWLEAVALLGIEVCNSDGSISGYNNAGYWCR